MSALRLSSVDHQAAPPDFLSAKLDTTSASSYAVLRDGEKHWQIQLPGSSAGHLGGNVQALSGTCLPFAVQRKTRKPRRICGQIEVPPSKSKKKAVFVWQCVRHCLVLYGARIKS
jgi:hypothetical protein